MKAYTSNEKHYCSICGNTIYAGDWIYSETDQYDEYDFVYCSKKCITKGE